MKEKYVGFNLISERKIPYPTSNPFTGLFSLVSCPNYTYEIGAWVAFTIMTQCIPGNFYQFLKNSFIRYATNFLFVVAGLFTLAGAYQMTVWALGKHRNYRKEFKDYPRRKAIFPFIL